MPELSIDGRSLRAPEGATILEAARSLGIEIPTLCFREGFPHHTSCLVCQVEETGSGRLLPACATPVAEGQTVLTASGRVRAARKAALELLLSEHRGDCEAPCARACPAKADIPGMLRKLAAGDWRGAQQALWSTLPLAGTLAHVCPAPCERSCRRNLIDSPLAIRTLKRAVAERGLQDAAPFTPRASPSTGKSIAVVGAGPAGLAAAFFLARSGHRCIVLDERAESGGLLRQAERLPPGVLEADLELLRRMGVELVANRRVTADDLAGLRQQHDALLLATGSPQSLVDLLSREQPFNRRTGACTAPGLFAGGNATRASPSRLAVQAVADGRRLAGSVVDYLAGRAVEPPNKAFDSQLGPLAREDLAWMAAEAQKRAREQTGGPASGPEGNVLEGAASEALRCLRCDCARKRSCSLRRLAGQYGAIARRFQGEEQPRLERLSGSRGLSFEPLKCIKCGLCVRIAERGDDRPALAFSGRGFEVRLRVPFDEDIGTALSSTAGQCVACCPTGALAWQR